MTAALIKVGRERIWEVWAVWPDNTNEVVSRNHPSQEKAEAVATRLDALTHEEDDSRGKPRYVAVRVTTTYEMYRD